MRVLLVNPPWVIRNRKNVWRNVASIMPPLGLAWLAAVLEQDGHDVTILDARVERFSLHEAVAWIGDHAPGTSSAHRNHATGGQCPGDRAAL